MADADEQRSLILQFRAVAGVSESRARFYLESASWILDVSNSNILGRGYLASSWANIKFARQSF